MIKRLLFVGLLALSQASWAQQTSFQPFLRAVPKAPTSADSIVVELIKPLGGCSPTPQNFYTRTIEGNAISIFHNFPPTGGIAEFGTCSEIYLLGALKAGIYKVHWNEEVAGGSRTYNAIAQFDLLVTNAAPAVIPTIGDIPLLSLALAILGIATFRLQQGSRRKIFCIRIKNS